ncbi:hypothetical protein SKAU_G00390390 [Synaphobranchus kaupii]|uniref:Uncharacterized protein n=1 Tax=Synaphobranchus kaupii TaxID=118154 RepID=A0A9Q1EBF7_SYNKA|nr:hypothetical protein SKAU_G00390390 [Synaphobranchus kaupii]
MKRRSCSLPGCPRPGAWPVLFCREAEKQNDEEQHVYSRRCLRGRDGAPSAARLDSALLPARKTGLLNPARIIASDGRKGRPTGEKGTLLILVSESKGERGAEEGNRQKDGRGARELKGPGLDEVFRILRQSASRL